MRGVGSRGEVGLTVWNFGDEVGDEEGGGDVGEVVSDELEVFRDTHHSGVLSSPLALVHYVVYCSLRVYSYVDHDLVDELHGVASMQRSVLTFSPRWAMDVREHNRDNAPIDLPSELDQVNGLSLSIIRLIRMLVHVQVRLIKVLLIGYMAMSMVILRVNIVMIPRVKR